MPSDWQTELAVGAVDAGVTRAAAVPDSRLDGVLTELGRLGVHVRLLPREEDCVAYAAGVRIAGGSPLVLLQSSGLGNCLNALGGLSTPYALGTPLVVSMRGALGETNPAQMPIGRASASLLETLGVHVTRVSTSGAMPYAIRGIVAMGGAGIQAALLLEPELGGQRERA